MTNNPSDTAQKRQCPECGADLIGKPLVCAVHGAVAPVPDKLLDLSEDAQYVIDRIRTALDYPHSRDTVRAERTTLLNQSDESTVVTVKAMLEAGVKVEDMRLLAEFTWDAEVKAWRIKELGFQDSVTLPQPLTFLRGTYKVEGL